MAERPDWYTYFDGVAEAIATRATCPRAQCGAVLVDWATKDIIATGYNGAPRGLPHCADEGCALEGEGTDAEHCIRTVHAEINAVLNAASRAGASTRNTALFLHSSDGRPPCPRCETVMRQAGITRWYTNAGSDV